MLSPFLHVWHRTTQNENARVLQQDAETTRAGHRRTTALGQEYEEDIWEENQALIRENQELKTTNDRAMTLIHLLANRSEAFQRIAVHLRASWPSRPADAGPVPRSVDQPDPQFDATVAEVKADQDWAARREARIQSVLKPAPRQR
jgi:hypothetical protein